LLNKALVILVSQGAKTFLVSLFIVYIFHRLVTRRLTSVAGVLRSYDVQHPPPPLRLQRTPPTVPDELDQLVAAFNGVSARLQGAYDDLRTANQQLERDIVARRRAEAALREGELRFRDYASVSDTGIGIAADDIPRLMQSFVQVDDVYKRRTQGSGLGPAIVRSLVERHGGSIRIESKEGAGTRITLCLPVGGSSGA
jgi:nitrogen-specific signal transduction histidine kinase